jgi:Holliday junction DNA helicase RuvA
MISYLKGKIVLKKDLSKERFVVLDVNGVGYKVFLSKKVFEKFAEQKPVDLGSPLVLEIELFCYLYVRENIMDLYGFANWEEREVFELLLGISGVGPKAAIEISALGPLEKLKKAIDAGDGKIFEGIPGIGKKRIAKILLELSGRIKSFKQGARDGSGVNEDPCVDAMVNMGFSKTLARQALEQIPKSMSEEDRIKEALKIL